MVSAVFPGVDMLAVDVSAVVPATEVVLIYRAVTENIYVQGDVFDFYYMHIINYSVSKSSLMLLL